MSGGLVRNGTVRRPPPECNKALSRAGIWHDVTLADLKKTALEDL